jgi:hypothetical protein
MHVRSTLDIVRPLFFSPKLSSLAALFEGKFWRRGCFGGARHKPFPDYQLPKGREGSFAGLGYDNKPRSCGCPPLHRTVFVGAMPAIRSLVFGPLYGAVGARVFGSLCCFEQLGLPLAFAMRGISINASGSKLIQPTPLIVAGADEEARHSGPRLNR